MLADKLLDLNVYELRYFALYTKERVQKTSGINPMKINLDWPSVKQDGKNSYLFILIMKYIAAGTWPPANPNWFK